MKKILGALMAAVISVIAVGPMVALATSTPITASVTVSPWCDIAVSPNVDFGAMQPGTTSATDVSTVVSMPTGNQASTPVSISGGAWTGGTGMLVSQTHWSLTALQAYVSMNALGSPASAGTFGPSSPETVYFKLGVPAGQSAAGYSQIITFTACS